MQGPDWEILLTVCVIALGVAIAYGAVHNHNRTAADREASERGAQRIYERED
jgi:hypothetical protein